MIHLVTNMPLAGIISAFMLSNFAGQAIVVVLLLGSVFVWTVLLTKLSDMTDAERKSEAFLVAFRKEPDPVALFMKRQKYEATPLYAIYIEACKAIGKGIAASGANPDDLFMRGMGGSKQKLSQLQVNCVRNNAERSMADQGRNLEAKMGFLALATTTAPLLGLLGTVWGLMESFEAVAKSNATALLSSVAPGIAGALLTTVVGLLVALPSAMGYNVLTDRIRRMNVEMENFVQEFMASLETQYLNQE